MLQQKGNQEVTREMAYQHRNTAMLIDRYLKDDGSILNCCYYGCSW